MGLSSDTPLGYLHENWWELQRYSLANFRMEWCNASDDKGELEANDPKYATVEDFMRNTFVFSYQNLGLTIQGIHRPYLAHLLRLTADKGPVSILDFGAGGGQLGLGLHELGFRVSFADITSQSLNFLLWRLKERRLDLPVYNLDFGLDPIPHQDVVICFDVIEHLDPDAQLRILHQCAQIGGSVMVNLIRGTGEEIKGLHFQVDAEAITKYVSETWPCYYEDYYPDETGFMRQRLLIFGDGLKTG